LLDISKNLAASVEVFYGVRNSSVCDMPLAQAARKIVDAGYGVEILVAQGWDDRALPDDALIEQMAEIGKSARIITTHACVNTWAPDVLKQEIAITRRMGIKQMVIHPYVLGIGLDDHEPSACQARELCKFAGDNGVFLVLENLGKLALPALRCAIDMVGSDPVTTGLGICVDIGHAHRSCTDDGIRPEKFLSELGDLIYEVHVDDNFGHKDLHLPPGHGSVDWLPVVEEMLKLRDEAVICLEIAWPADPLNALKESHDFLIATAANTKTARAKDE
jgi:sugar phosphate isomerase/epimerase